MNESHKVQVTERKSSVDGSRYYVAKCSACDFYNRGRTRSRVVDAGRGHVAKPLVWKEHQAIAKSRMNPFKAAESDAKFLSEFRAFKTAVAGE